MTQLPAILRSQSDKILLEFELVREHGIIILHTL